MNLTNNMFKAAVFLTAALAITVSQQLKAQDYTELDCLVRPEMYIELSSPVDTTMTDIMVKVGDSIKKGQPLIQLENSVQKVKVELAKKQAASTSEIENRKIQLTYAQRNKQRIANMFTKKSVSQLEKDKADTEFSLARLELVKAREQHVLAQLALKQTEAELALRTLKSPIDGIVVDTYARVGESVADRNIMRLAQIDPLSVELIAPTEYFGLIKKGMEGDIYPEKPADKTFKATVTVVDQLIDPASGSFTVRMALPNPGDELIGGVNCQARFAFKPPSESAHDL